LATEAELMGVRPRPQSFFGGGLVEQAGRRSISTERPEWRHRAQLPLESALHHWMALTLKRWRNAQLDS
jgi:hypothetical protein